MCRPGVLLAGLDLLAATAGDAVDVDSHQLELGCGQRAQVGHEPVPELQVTVHDRVYHCLAYVSIRALEGLEQAREHALGAAHELCGGQAIARHHTSN